MGRLVFIICFVVGIMTILTIMMMSRSHATAMHDAISFGETIKIASSASETVKGITEVSTTVKSALDTANQSLNELSSLNSVLGSPLSNSFLSKLSAVKSTSRKYGGLLSALSNAANGNPGSAYGLNRASHSVFGTPDVSKYITMKKRIEDKFFTPLGSSLHIKEAQKFRVYRNHSARNSVVNTLAVAKLHKEELVNDHKDLESIAEQANSSGDLNHQILVQTKILERIAQSLEKLILLQSQQMEFQAKTYLADRDVDERNISTNKTRS